MGLGLKWLTSQIVQNVLPRTPNGSLSVQVRIVNRRVLATDLLQQALTKLINKIGQRHMQLIGILLWGT